jgi:outer membrane usher protein
VESENRTVGKTNSRGKLLVHNLRSYEKNNLAIDPDSLPFDAMLETTREMVMPHKGAGVVVRFGLKHQSAGALVTLVTPTGEVIESGSMVSVDGSDDSFVVGYDGQTYLTGLSGTVGLTIQRPNAGSCTANVDLARAATNSKAICKDIP